MIAAPKPIHTTTIPIRWDDLDAHGHVSNSVCFRHMEQARVERLELARDQLGDVPGRGRVIVNASCSFLAPLSYPGVVEVRMFLGTAGRSSIESHDELRMQGRKYADGAAKIVWIDLGTQRSAPLPEPLLARCA